MTVIREIETYRQHTILLTDLTTGDAGKRLLEIRGPEGTAVKAAAVRPFLATRADAREYIRRR